MSYAIQCGTEDTDSKQGWVAQVIERHPDAVFGPDGTRIWAQVHSSEGAVDVGYWSIVGGFGRLTA